MIINLNGSNKSNIERGIIFNMKKINFNEQDKQQFQDWGYPQNDINQISQLKYRFHNYCEKEMTFEEAVNAFGRERILGAIGRAAFHSTGSISEKWGVESSLFK